MMNAHLVGYMLWGSLVISILLTIPAVVKKSVGLLLMAAGLSLAFGIGGLMTVGILGLLLTCLQIALLIGYALKVKTRVQILLFIAAIAVWINVLVFVGNPFGWK
jgi:hypothetical protein